MDRAAVEALGQTPFGDGDSGVEEPVQALIYDLDNKGTAQVRMVNGKVASVQFSTDGGWNVKRVAGAVESTARTVTLLAKFLPPAPRPANSVALTRVTSDYNCYHRSQSVNFDIGVCKSC